MWRFSSRTPVRGGITLFTSENMSKGVSNSYVMRTQIVSRNKVPYDRREYNIYSHTFVQALRALSQFDDASETRPHYFTRSDHVT